MARRVTWGTLGRSAKYLLPATPRRQLRWGLAAAALLLGLVLGAHAIGFRQSASPGQLSARHAVSEDRCETCHVSRQGVSTMRCERCHDPAGEKRLSYWAHALSARDIGRAASLARDLPCAYCHVEHRGRETRLDAVDNAYCAACHFGTLAAHPEFALLRQPTKVAVGLRFAHDRHLLRIKNRKSLRKEDACLTCHEPTPGGPDMEPVSFQRHCADCHARPGTLIIQTPTGVAGDPPPPEGLRTTPPGAAGSSAELAADAPLQHKDPRVVARAEELRRELYPERIQSRRARLQAEADALADQVAQAIPAASLDEPALIERESSLSREMAGLEQGEARKRVQRQLERVQDELRLRAAGVPRPPRALLLQPVAVLRSQLADTRAALEALDQAPAPPMTDAERLRKSALLDDLVATCARCHEAAFEDVAPAHHTLHTTFEHQPHVGEVDCTHCHTTVEGSTASRDFNVPGIDTCRGCHGNRIAPSDCRVCHTFHPPTGARASRWAHASEN